MTRENDLHDQYKKEIQAFLNKCGLNCVDYEKVIESENGKKPDIKEEKNDILIEIKILFLNEELKEEQRKVNKELRNKGGTTYWFQETSNFRGHLDDCRRKFRSFPSKKTMVIFVNEMGHQKQPLEELISGQEYFTYSIYDDDSCKLTGYGNKDREIRKDRNKEIGILGEYYPRENKIVLIHNSYADKVRRVSFSVFDNCEHIEQKVYRYENGEVQFNSRVAC